HLPVPDPHLCRHRDPRDQPGPRDHAADGRQSQAHLPADIRAGRRAGRAGGLPPRPAVRHPSRDRPVLRSDRLPDLRARRARQPGRRFPCRLPLRAVHLGGRLRLPSRMGLRARLRVLHRDDVLEAPGALREAPVTTTTASRIGLALLALLLAAPFLGIGAYPMHLMIMAMLWGFIYTSWALMGRLGMVSLGHGAFFGIGAYAVVMLWNHFGLPPLLGAAVAVVASAVLAFLIGYPCFHFRIVGHYFAVVHRALAYVVRLTIVGLRDSTGGSLGVAPVPGIPAGESASLFALQFSDRSVWFYVVLVMWLLSLYVWRRVDRSMTRL